MNQKKSNPFVSIVVIAAMAHPRRGRRDSLCKRRNPRETRDRSSRR